MRILPVLFIVTLATPVTAQTERDSFQSLQRILQPGQMIVVTDNAGHEVSGTISSVSDSSLTIGDRVFPEDTVYAVRRTDPLGNGTVAGVGVGLAATAAFAAACGRYHYSEEKGPCMAAAISSGLLWVPMAALIGRAIDRVKGNESIYQRRSIRQFGSAFTPVLNPNGFALHVSMSF
jgi:hypothetical protein